MQTVEPHHISYTQIQVFFLRSGNHRLAFRKGDCQRLLHQDVLTGVKRFHRLRVMEIRRGSNVNRINLRIG